MTRKASHPCHVCGRQMKRHRKAKATVCGKTCRDELRVHLRTLRRLTRNPGQCIGRNNR